MINWLLQHVVWQCINREDNRNSMCRSYLVLDKDMTTNYIAVFGLLDPSPLSLGTIFPNSLLPPPPPTHKIHDILN